MVVKCGKKIDKKSKTYKEAVQFVNQVVMKIKPHKYAAVLSPSYNVLLDLLKILDVPNAFVHILNMDGRNEYPIASVLEFAEKHGWDLFETYLINKIKSRGGLASNFSILAKCAGYKDIKDLKPVELEEEICEKLAKIVVQSWNSYTYLDCA